MDQRHSQLSLKEEEQFKNICSSLIKDQNVETLTIKYYSEYKLRCSSNQAEKIGLNLKCAYFLAEKSQWVTTVKGEKVRNTSLSLNELIKDYTLEQITLALKSYLELIKIQDTETVNDLLKIVKQISISINFYSKFYKVMDKLDLKDNTGYSQTLTQFIWLMFIQFKSEILHNSLEVMNNTCMLAHTICFVLAYSWNYNQPGFFLNELKLSRNSPKETVINSIREHVLGAFLIKQLDVYENIAKRFQNYFYHLIKYNIIRVSNDKDNFLSPEILMSNYKRLDTLYQKKLNFSQLDQRVFYKDKKKTNNNPFTPFSRQAVRIPNKFRLGGNIVGLGNNLSNTDRNTQQANYFSHRILNYEAMDNQQVQKDQPVVDIKLPKTIIPSPMLNKPHLLTQTPYTASMTIYNYVVNDLTNRLKQKKLHKSKRESDKLAFQLINEVLENMNKNDDETGLSIKQNLIFSVYKVISEEFYALNPKQCETQGMLRAFLVMSLEVVSYVSNIEVSFTQFQEAINTDCLSLWRACDFFLKFDTRAMPAKLKVHLLDIQVEIISDKIWADQTNIFLIVCFLKNQKSNSNVDPQVIERLTKRILHQAAFQIVQLCKNCIQEKQDQEFIAEESFSTMKEVFLNHCHMLLNRNLDQIIMCTIFLISKFHKFDVKFQDIRSAYSLCNNHLSQQKKTEIFSHLYNPNSQSNEDQYMTIIAFYNNCFMKSMSPYLKAKSHNSSRPQTQRNQHQNDVNLLLQSPLGAIITKQMGLGKKNYDNKMQPNRNITPRLHAYTESPLLKNEFAVVKNPVHSKKVLDFDSDQNENTPNIKKDSLNDTCKQNQPDCNRQVNNFFNNKKFLSNKNLKTGSQTPALIKSPCSKQPTSPNYKQTLVKDGGYSSASVIYTKRDFGKNVNMNINHR